MVSPEMSKSLHRPKTFAICHTFQGKLLQDIGLFTKDMLSRFLISKTTQEIVQPESLANSPLK